MARAFGVSIDGYSIRITSTKNKAYMCVQLNSNPVKGYPRMSFESIEHVAKYLAGIQGASDEARFRELAKSFQLDDIRSTKEIMKAELDSERSKLKELKLFHDKMTDDEAQELAEIVRHQAKKCRDLAARYNNYR